MDTVTLVSAGQKYQVPNLGPALNEQVALVYNSFMTGGVFDESIFQEKVKSYFEQHALDHTLHDHYFNAFAQLWLVFLNQGGSLVAEQIWKLALTPVQEWEKASGQRAHKGTPYYFLGVTALLSRDIERGFLPMHRSLTEDVKTLNQPIPPTPGNAFVTLDYERQEQFFRPWVLRVAELLEKFLSEYRQKRNHTLTIQEFRKNFLANPDLRPAAILFVFLLNKMILFNDHVDNGLTQSDFAGLLELDLLFGFCLVADALIKQKFPNNGANFLRLAAFLLEKAGYGLDETQLGEINRKFLRDFGKTMPQLSSGQVCGLNLRPSEVDVALCYGIRNRGAHNIEGHEYIFQNFAEFTQRVLNCLFLAVEVLY